MSHLVSLHIMSKAGPPRRDLMATACPMHDTSSVVLANSQSMFYQGDRHMNVSIQDRGTYVSWRWFVLWAGSNVVSVAEHVVMMILTLVRNYIPAYKQVCLPLTFPPALPPLVLVVMMMLTLVPKYIPA
jgi:hypothetical protein